MARNEVTLKVSADSKPLDELLSKLEEIVDLEEETNQLVIKPDVDSGELENLLNEFVEVKEVGEQPVTPKIETGGITKGIADFGSKANSVFSNIGSRCDALGSKFSNLASGMGSLMAGIGLAEMATQAWEGATEKQTNQLLLARKYGTTAANDISDAISSAVTKTPGDDAFLTSMLSNASLKAKMTKKDLDAMAASIADYQTMSKASGSNTFEAQGEIRNYLMTGETGRMKDTPLSGYLKELESADTVTERVTALNKALNELGYSGASGMASAENSMETFKGTLQNALASVGQMFLPAIQGLLDGFLSLDNALGGNLAKSLIVVGGGFATIVAGAGALGAVLPAIGSGFRAIGTGIDLLSKGPAILSYMVKGMGEFRAVINAVREAESVGAAVKAAYNVVTNAETVANTANEASFWSLAASELAALWPILAVIAAIVALVAILWYLYNNNEQVRQAIDGLIQALQQFAGEIWNALQPVIQFAQQAVQWFIWLWSQIQPVLQMLFSFVMNIFGQIFVLLIARVTNIVNGVRNGFQLLVTIVRTVFAAVWAVISAAVALWNTIVGRVRSIVNSITGAWNSITGKISSALGGVYNAIASPFQRAYNTVKPLIDAISSGASAIGGALSAVGLGSAGIVTGSAGITTGGFGNSDLVGNIRNNIGGTTNINVSGIIEESAGEYIVNKVNDELYKQRVTRGL